MYCSSCGKKVQENALFCSSCGEKLIDQLNRNDESAANTDSSRAAVKSGVKNSLSSLLVWLIPIVSLFGVGGGSYYYYTYEQDKNKIVLELKEQAEAKALDGEFVEAEKLLHKAMKVRPEYLVLEENLQVVELGLAYTNSLQKTDDYIKKQKYDEASKEIAELQEKIKKQDGPLFEPFLAKIEAKQTTLTIAKVKSELNDLKTVDELAAKLSVLSGLEAEEAGAIKTDIEEKIVQLSINQVEEKLVNKHFNDALAFVDKGLQYVVNNEKLLSVKDSIISEQAAFEKAEKQRLEQAMELAAQEDLQNRTEAVEVLSFQAEVDEYGDLTISGEVKNVATRSISSVKISYSVYDLEGNFLGNDSTSVYPYDLERNDVGSFDEIYYGVYEDVDVQIDELKWYLN